MNTKELQPLFVKDLDIPWETVAQGVKRKIMAFEESLMIVKVAFEKGGIGVLHQHPHIQITNVESGSFEVEIAGVKKILNAGDVFFIPSNAWHGAVCLEPGVLIDTFSPMRKDFIK